MSDAHAGEVAWYVTGRFFSQGEQLLDVGYFLHLQGTDAPLFCGVASEATAHFTFAAAPFTARSITNGGLTVGVDARGTFRVFLREKGGASFDDPSTFAGGRCIGVFERVAMVPTAQLPALMSNVFTARLVSSEPFDFAGRRHNLRVLIGYGVTQWGIAAATAVTPPAGYDSAVPFVGSAIRVA